MNRLEKITTLLREHLFASRVAAFVAVTIFSLAAHGQAPATITTNPPIASGIEKLELLDGSVLRGELRAIDSTKGLIWKHPDAQQPLEFKPDNLALIRFPSAINFAPAAAPATCQFRFANGDEFFGNLVALNERDLELETWFGGKFKTPRETLRSIRFFPKGVGTLYEGPTSLEGWKLGQRQNPRAWIFNDGALVANAAGTLGRDFKLPAASRFEFDLTWSGPFSLLFSYYTEAFDAFNYSSSSYLFYINPGSVSLQRVQAGSGSSTMGRTETIAAMVTKRTAHLEFRASKTDNILELLVDGKLVNQWKEYVGWVGTGSGVLFYAQTDNTDLKISNIKVSEWDGYPGNETATNAAPKEDQLFLANRDKVSGKIIGLTDGKLKINSTAATLEIPLQRVTQIFLGGTRTNLALASPWEIQASVSGGGKISFALEKWDEEKILGKNNDFGPISLNTKSIRQIRFNPGKSKPTGTDAEAADNLIWEINVP